MSPIGFRRKAREQAPLTAVFQRGARQCATAGRGVSLTWLPSRSCLTV